uniref:Immunoglobulin V-set domain-containing protein n=1 Tax=Maylandia zebra TaxID=106582 RepID=A0A3P9DNW4_9CICH
MFFLSLAWLLLTGPLWTSGQDLKQKLLEEEVSVRYPKIPSSETIDCDCGSMACDLVFWFHSDMSSKVHFLGRCNNADRTLYGDNVDETRFKLSKRGSKSFALRIINVTKEDRGIYSCVLKEKNLNEVWKPGTLLLPGEKSCFLLFLMVLLGGFGSGDQASHLLIGRLVIRSPA